MADSKMRANVDINLAPKFLRDLFEITHAQLLAAGIRDGEAADIANDLCFKMTKKWPRRNVYFPGPEFFERATRDVDIYNDWLTNNLRYDELVQKYDTSEVWVRSIINRMHADAKKRRQPNLC